MLEVWERETEFVMCTEGGGEVGRGWRGGRVERVELLSAIWVSSLVLRWWKGRKGKSWRDGEREGVNEVGRVRRRGEQREGRINVGGRGRGGGREGAEEGGERGDR